MEELIPLGLLTRGQRAEIGQVVGQVEHVHRLQEMGLRSGVQIEMLQPGSPCIIQIEGHRLCFRDADLFSVLVRPGESC